MFYTTKPTHPLGQSLNIDFLFIIKPSSSAFNLPDDPAEWLLSLTVNLPDPKKGNKAGEGSGAEVL